MAKLIGAKCPHCGAGVKLDPDLDFVTCNFCHTSSFIVTPQKKAAKTPPPPNAQVIEIGHVVSAVWRAIIGVFGALTLIGIVVAVAVLMAARQGPSSADAEKLMASALTDLAERARRAADEPAKVESTIDYTQDASAVPALLAPTLGPVIEARELVIYPEYVIFELRSRQFPDQVDRLTLRKGDLGEKSPVTLSSSERRQLSNLTFFLADVAWAKVSTMSRDALSRMQVEGGKVTHIIVEKARASRKAGVMFRVYASAPREESRYFEYDATGRFRRKR